MKADMSFLQLTNSESKINADFGQPFLFRTTIQKYYQSTLTTGTLCLHSSEYFRETEDRDRCDANEGANMGILTLPQRVKYEGYAGYDAIGGSVGQIIVPHYILSLHGMSISLEQHEKFGGHTFGIKNFEKLAFDIHHEVKKQIKSDRFRKGAVCYRHTTITCSEFPDGGAIGELSSVSGGKSIYIHPLSTDVLRKSPVKPFIEQDEWRIVVFTDGYLNNNSKCDLLIQVDPSHFYEYSCELG